MNNPFTWNIVNPSLCYGRDTIIHDLIDGLAGNPRYSFGLAGGRRMGKTTLLRRIQQDLEQRAERWRESGLLVIPVYVDGLTLSRPPVANDIWELLMRGLHARLRYQSHTVDKPDFEAFKNVVSTTFRDIDEQPRVVVLFDEIEPFLGCEWAGAFLSHWRALLSNTPGLSECFTAVFAGARELDVLRHDVGSPQFGLDEANDAVEILQHVGLVEERDEGFSFCCGGAMFQRWYARYGALADAPLHDPELYDRLRAIGEDLAHKYLSAWRIYQSKMPNYSGAVGELRDTLTLLLDVIAPITSVQAEEGFRFEQNQSRATRRQRVRYAARRQHNRDRAREIASDYDLVDSLSDSLAQMVVGSYGRASGQTHTTATREQAYRALKQWEGIFAQLTPARRDELEV